MSSDHHDAPSTAPPSSTPEWVDEYNSVLAKREYKAPVIPGPHCCAVCCTFFASIGALFLFLVSGLLKSHYPYVHIEGDLEAMASSTGYAGASWGLGRLYTRKLCYWLFPHKLLFFLSRTSLLLPVPYRKYLFTPPVSFSIFSFFYCQVFCTC